MNLNVKKGKINKKTIFIIVVYHLIFFKLKKVQEMVMKWFKKLQKRKRKIVRENDWENETLIKI
jgi:hypothetical protein